jgi:aminopeptidase N
MDNMNASKTDGELLTYYRSFLSVADSSEAISFLKALSLEDSTTGRLPKTGSLELHNRLSKILRPKDRFEIAAKLIAIGEKNAGELLSTLERLNTDDASKRDAYAAKAGFATVENKKKYFDDFIKNKEISESWIEAAFDSWNEPAQEKLTLPYLERALAELPNLKRDRKIFFVNGWLGAFIGGQRSPEALKVVNDFLRENRKLDADLKRKILERVDGLERAVRIRKKYSNG